MSVVSPLALMPRVAHERRYIFGAVADRLVPPDQVRDLWEHWGHLYCLGNAFLYLYVFPTIDQGHKMRHPDWAINLL